MPAKKQSGPNVYDEVFKRLIKEHKIKTKGEQLPLKIRGGAKMIEFIEAKKGKKLDPKVRRELTRMLNTELRALRGQYNNSKQIGGSRFTDFFTKDIPNWWNSKPVKSFRSGFVRGFTGTAKALAPVLDVATTAAPFLAPVTAGVHAFNKAVGN